MMQFSLKDLYLLKQSMWQSITEIFSQWLSTDINFSQSCITFVEGRACNTPRWRKCVSFFSIDKLHGKVSSEVIRKIICAFNSRMSICCVPKCIKNSYYLGKLQAKTKWAVFIETLHIPLLPAVLEVSHFLRYTNLRRLTYHFQIRLHWQWHWCSWRVKQEATSSLKLPNVAGIFYILISGLCMSLLIAGIEFLHKSRTEARRRKVNSHTTSLSIRPIRLGAL